MRALLALATAGLLIGCHSDEPDPKIEAARLDRARTMRTLFDRAKGDYSALSSAERAAFVKLYNGDAAKAEEGWRVMRDGPGARSLAPTGSGR